MDRRTNEVMVTGSFDPVTLGHIDIIKRASEIFRDIAVVMFINEAKEYMFTFDERLEMLKAACGDIKGVRVDKSSGRVVDYAKEHGISTVIRGIRNSADLDYEMKMAAYNKENGGIETVFLMADEGLLECSSTLVRKKIAEGGDLSQIFPHQALSVVERYYKKEN